MVIFYTNCLFEIYNNDKKLNDDNKWSIVGNEVHIERKNRTVYVYRINKDLNITYIAYIRDEKRTDAPKDYHYTYKRIK